MTRELFLFYSSLPLVYKSSCHDDGIMVMYYCIIIEQSNPTLIILLLYLYTTTQQFNTSTTNKDVWQRQGGKRIRQGEYLPNSRHFSTPTSLWTDPLTYLSIHQGGAKRHRKVLRDNIQVSLHNNSLPLPCLPYLTYLLFTYFGPGNHQARYPSFSSSWGCQAYLWFDLRGDSWCPQGLPWKRHPWFRHLHWYVSFLSHHHLSSPYTSHSPISSRTTEHARRKTVTALDVVYALKRQGRTLYGFGG